MSPVDSESDVSATNLLPDKDIHFVFIKVDCTLPSLLELVVQAS